MNFEMMEMLRVDVILKSFISSHQAIHLKILSIIAKNYVHHSFYFFNFPGKKIIS